MLAATCGDAWARSSLRDGAHGWTYGDTVGWLSTSAARSAARPVPTSTDLPQLRFAALGPPAAVAALIDVLVDSDELPAGTRATVPRGTPALLSGPVAIPEVTDWDFRWTDLPPPPLPGEERVGWISDEATLIELLAVANPTASTQPGDPAIRRWCGLGYDGMDEALVACAADTSRATGVGHISSVATRPSRRGRGLGVAVTGWLTRRLLEEFELVTLGMYAGNVAGGRLYHRLGYRDEHHFSSGLLVHTRPDWT